MHPPTHTHPHTHPPTYTPAQTHTPTGSIDTKSSVKQIRHLAFIRNGRSGRKKTKRRQRTVIIWEFSWVESISFVHFTFFFAYVPDSVIAAHSFFIPPAFIYSLHPLSILHYDSKGNATPAADVCALTPTCTLRTLKGFGWREQIRAKKRQRWGTKVRGNKDKVEENKGKK